MIERTTRENPIRGGDVEKSVVGEEGSGVDPEVVRRRGRATEEIEAPRDVRTVDQILDAPSGVRLARQDVADADASPIGRVLEDQTSGRRRIEKAVTDHGAIRLPRAESVGDDERHDREDAPARDERSQSTLDENTRDLCSDRRESDAADRDAYGKKMRRQKREESRARTRLLRGMRQECDDTAQ